MSKKEKRVGSSKVRPSISYDSCHSCLSRKAHWRGADDGSLKHCFDSAGKMFKYKCSQKSEFTVSYRLLFRRCRMPTHRQLEQLVVPRALTSNCPTDVPRRNHGRTAKIKDSHCSHSSVLSARCSIGGKSSGKIVLRVSEDCDKKPCPNSTPESHALYRQAMTERNDAPSRPFQCRSKEANSYVVTMANFATGYLDAEPLSDIVKYTKGGRVATNITPCRSSTIHSQRSGVNHYLIPHGGN